MSFAGYLVKVGDYTIPANKYIKSQSYKVTLNVQDLDSFRDANGVLHRDSLEHRVGKVEFETPAMMTNVQMAELFKSISDNYSVPAERKFVGTFYVPELDTYMSQDMYMSDPAFSVYGIFGDVIKYSSVRIAFIAY